MELGAPLYLLLAIAVGILASREFGRSGIGWFVLAVLLTPLVGLLLFILPARRRPCPFCAESIQASATLCRFCGQAVTPTGERNRLPVATRVVLLLLILAVLATALLQCQSRFDWWWRGDSVQVKMPTSSFVIRNTLRSFLMD